MQIMTYTQTGGAASSTEIDPDYLKHYTTHQIQVAGIGSDTATIAGMGPAETYTDLATLAANDVYFLEGYFEKLKITWGSASGGSVSIRSYNLDAIDGG